MAMQRRPEERNGPPPHYRRPKQMHRDKLHQIDDWQISEKLLMPPLYGERNETANSLISKCCKLTSKEYKRRYDQMD